MLCKTLLFAFVVGIVLLASGPRAVKAHSRFQCPQPRAATFGEKNGPCGGVARSGHPYTTFAPGLNTLVIAESVYHSGSPWSIALATTSDAVEYVLLDQIPQDSASKSPSESNPHIIRVNVIIPDVDCSDCALLMYNPMVGSGSTCARNTTTCSAYYSCANIKINGSSTVSSYTSSYSYTPPSGWPYTARFMSYQSLSDSYVQGFPQGQANRTQTGPCALALSPSSPSSAPTPYDSPQSASSSLSLFTVLQLLTITLFVTSFF